MRTQRYMNLPVRDVNGVLLLDKPSGFSSSFFLNKIKKIFCAKKAGHVGTLDPIATGMLPICFGKSTKFSKYLLQFNKQYRVLAKLGESTDTFDAYGVIKQILPVNLTKEKLKQCLRIFQGKICQVPPMFSALKYNGVPLYTYARKGINIPRKSRIVHVYNLSILNSRSNNIIELDITCSTGTYVRSIVHDIGQYLGCGAHVIELRRLNIGKYTDKSMINIKNLESIFYNDLFNDLIVLKKLDQFLISSDSFMY